MSDLKNNANYILTVGVSNLGVIQLLRLYSGREGGSVKVRKYASRGKGCHIIANIFFLIEHLVHKLLKKLPDFPSCLKYVLKRLYLVHV